MAASDPHFHDVKLVPPSYASAALKSLTATVQSWLQDSVDLLGNNDPNPPPKLLVQLENKGLVTESAGTAKMADDYAGKKAQLDALAAQMTKDDDGIRTSTYEAGELANSTWVTIKGRIGELQATLSDPENNVPIVDKKTGAKYLPAAVEAKLTNALIAAVTDVSDDLDTTYNQFQEKSKVMSGADSGASPSAPSLPAGTASASPQEISGGQKVKAQEIYDYLIKQYHLTPAQAAGIVGNMQTESGFDTGAWNSKEGALGLCQWEGGRLDGLKAFAKANGTSVTDWKTQVDYAMSELQGKQPQYFSASQAAKARTALQASSSSAGGSAISWAADYEICAPESYAQRVANANNLSSTLVTTSA
ncbi:phage tail tip lysozyme [Nocardia sp. alder85J]|uniref:phage tail tip lysozyme n=1 Tax=Nocardia sp. alder85J TaxID=2862949 RepID=UPI001CD4960D|nr:phage tail tip lysozyme [Nocardia sp. alder85J]MCX4092218.1 phage tail tip lysozyme [Nocardia sp. alder85J]